MKIAIISDIKSNVYALEKFLIDATNKKVDAIVNLGDSFYGDIQPKATYDLIRKSGLINICGNEDRKILEASLEELNENPLLKSVYEDLGEEVLYWIQDLPFEKLIGEDFYIIHGTYFSDSDYLLEDENNTPRSDEEIIKLLDDIKAKFIFCSNSEKAKCIKLNSEQIVINPGSLSKENTYSILDINDEEFEVKFIKIEKS